MPISMIDRLMTLSAQTVVSNVHLEIKLYQDSISFQLPSPRVRLCNMRTNSALPRNMKPRISSGIPRLAMLNALKYSISMRATQVVTERFR